MRDNTENNYDRETLGNPEKSGGLNQPDRLDQPNQLIQPDQPNQSSPPDQPQEDGGAEDALEQAIIAEDATTPEYVGAEDALEQTSETEPHLWDQIFKRIAHDMPKQLLPLIKLAFGKEYPKDTPIKPLATEYPVEHPASGAISSIHTDSTLEVGFDDIYHFECDSGGDGELVIRMFRYDSGVAITYRTKAGGRGGSMPEIKFPHSAVIYVQGKEKIPDRLECKILFQDGSEHIYSVPTVKVQSLSLEEIEEEKLNILVPFLPLRFRKRERKVDGKKTGEFDLDEGELTDFYEQLIVMLRKECEAGDLSQDEHNVLVGLLNKSMRRVFGQDARLRKEVKKMAEPLLELEIDKHIAMVKSAKADLSRAEANLSRAEKERDEAEAHANEMEANLSKAEAERDELQRQLSAMQAQIAALTAKQNG